MVEISEQKENVKNKFIEKQIEKSYYLNEFKERIIISVKKSEVENGHVLQEIIEAIHEPDAEALKMRRDIDLKFLKPYIEVAEKIGVKYTLVDAVGLQGDIGIIVISKEEFDNEEVDTDIGGLGSQFEERGLKAYYAKHLHKKICNRHYKLIKEKYPLLKGSFKKFSLIDRIFGAVCPICEEEKREKKNGN